MSRLWWVVGVVGVLGGCKGKEADSSEASDTSDTASGDLCDAAPIVNYNNFGQGFMTENCQSCHASTTLNRYGAPEEVTFDTVEQVWSFSNRILERAAVDDPSMPPRGGTSADDHLRLRYWLLCQPSGT